MAWRLIKQKVFLAWCLVKHREKFTFILPLNEGELSRSNRFEQGRRAPDTNRMVGWVDTSAFWTW